MVIDHNFSKEGALKWARYSRKKGYKVAVWKAKNGKWSVSRKR